jgi:hypothetical protein
VIASIFQSLEGSWRFHRVISNAGRIEGRAVFTRSKDILRYREDGLFFRKDKETLKVFREYDYLYNREKDQICVYFTEEPKRLFHTLEFYHNLPITAKATHLCQCDTYEALYEFTSSDEFTLAYCVKGPKKDYSITTIFNRCLNGGIE